MFSGKVLGTGTGGNNVAGKFVTEDAADADAAVTDEGELPCKLFFTPASFAGCFPLTDPDKNVPDEPSPLESSSGDSSPDESSPGEEATAVDARSVSVFVVLSSCAPNAAAKLFEPKLDVVRPKIPASAI
jgi:hypothetical protein